MHQRTSARSLWVGLLFLVALLAGCSSNGAEFPEFTAPVVDSFDAVDDAIETSLNAELENFRATSGPQIAVAIIGSTGSASIEDYSIDLARTWGVGDASRDDGVLILIALEDRRMRIDVGSGVEGDLTDVQAGRIVDSIMLPLLRADDVDGAVVQGARAVMAVWRGEDLPSPTVTPTDEVPTTGFGDWVGALLFFLFIGGSIGLAIIGRIAQHTTWTSGGSRRGYGGVFIPGGFGSSGRGFGGGFGGGFSGGGAGGSW